MSIKSGALRGAVIALGALCSVLFFSSPALAAQGSIDHVERKGDTVHVLYSLPGSGVSNPDVETLAVSLNAQSLDAAAELAAESADEVKRTTILTIDTSNSMRRDDRFAQARAAAQAFLQAAPPDLHIGIVTFANEVVVAQEPSLDRTESARILEGLALTRQTRLHDGIISAVETAGQEGARSLLVLSDGKDTSSRPIEDVVLTIEEANVRVDVIALDVPASGTAVLDQFAAAGSGETISAEDPAALTDLFTAEAQSLAQQLLITFDVPSAERTTEGTLKISVESAGQTYVDSAFVNVSAESTETAGDAATDLEPAQASGPIVSRELMLAGIAAAGLGLLVLLLGVLGGLGGKTVSVEDRVSAYTRKGSRKLAESRRSEAQGVTAQAVGIAEKALRGNVGLSARLGDKLEAAGLAIKPAEWVLIHAGVAFMLGLMGLLLSSGSVIYMGIGLAFGLAAPWAYLDFKKGRRVKAFKAGLADTLQLMAGSLSAGLSLAQSVDTVVREGQDPVSAEFRRALVEARLGVEIEDALESVALRMSSKDFEWVVMAIRIQREVGGNLSELLGKVAATIREREYLERQILTLSAEGRLSVWILGGLPPGFMAYLALANPTYLEPLVTTLIGYIMLGVMVVLLVVGVLWMKKLVKVEV